MKGRGVHNPAAKTYMFASPVYNIRTVNTQVNAQIHGTGMAYVPSLREYIN